MARNRYASSSANSGTGSKLTVMARLGYLLSKRVICSPKGFPPVFLPHTVTVAVAVDECQSWRGDAYCGVQ